MQEAGERVKGTFRMDVAYKARYFILSHTYSRPKAQTQVFLDYSSISTGGVQLHILSLEIRIQ
jgi:hypothetical protein